jgi:cyanophycin synthetase
VPGILAKALRAAGVPDEAISIIPDEQLAVDAALQMGRSGDLLLVFADALVRSWKQIIKFRPEGAAPAPHGDGITLATHVLATEPVFDDTLFADLGDLVRDERGVRYSRESDD